MINRLFGAYIESKTHQLDEGPSIQMRLRNKVINRKRKMAPSQECQQESDDFYVKFCLQKTSLVRTFRAEEDSNINCELQI